MRGIGVCVIALLIATPTRDQPDEVKTVWESAIQAKGGRALLHGIRSAARSYTSRWRVKPWKKEPSSFEECYVLPYRSWLWGDERPTGLFGLSVRVVNLERDFAQMTYYNPDRPEQPNQVVRPSENDRQIIRRFQLFTFMETAWLAPTLLKTWTAWDFLVRELVVETSVAEEIYEWHLDSSTRLPRRVIFKSQQKFGTEIVEYRLKDYKPVDGLMLPHTVQMGSGLTPIPLEENIHYQLNVAYDESIFDRAPSIAAGPKAWMSKEQPAMKSRMPK